MALGEPQAELEMSIRRRLATFRLKTAPARTMARRMRENLRALIRTPEPLIEELAEVTAGYKRALKKGAAEAEALENGSGSKEAYIDYRQMLQDEFERRKAKNMRYSFRAFSRALGVSPSTLVNVMKGRRRFSADLAAELAERLELPEKLARAFCLSVEHEAKKRPMGSGRGLGPEVEQAARHSASRPTKLARGAP
jgi:transcriptional regulator with XRE-family HTH domain